MAVSTTAKNPKKIEKNEFKKRKKGKKKKKQTSGGSLFVNSSFKESLASQVISVRHYSVKIVAINGTLELPRFSEIMMRLNNQVTILKCKRTRAIQAVFLEKVSLTAATQKEGIS